MVDHSKIINRAIDFSRNRPVDRKWGRQKNYRGTAIITDKKGMILSVGFNSKYKTHPRQKYWTDRNSYSETLRLMKEYLHAEMDAIVSCENIEKAHTIHVSIVSKVDRCILSRPCEEICLQEIKWYTPIKYMVYTTGNGENWVKEKVKR